MLCWCVNYDIVCVSVNTYMISTEITIYNYYMPMQKKNKCQVNLPIGSYKIVNVRRLHNSRVQKIYPLQYNTLLENTLCSHVPTKYKGVTPLSNQYSCWILWIILLTNALWIGDDRFSPSGGNFGWFPTIPRTMGITYPYHWYLSTGWFYDLLQQDIISPYL